MSAAITTPPRVTTPPPLEPGDHLSGPEFLRRYAAMPEKRKAELIEGVVHMPSPVRADWHGGPHSGLMFWLTYYWAFTQGVWVYDNTTMRLDLANLPQPDAMLLILPRCGGRASIGTDGYVTRGAELIAEITASSASIDLGTKMSMYRQHKVREYVVWRVLDQAIDWFVLHRSKYEPLVPDAQGILHSKTFPGLCLDPVALMNFDLQAVLRLLQQGFATPEHAAFVAKLRQAGSNKP